METQMSAPKARTYARIVGGLYLLLFFLGPFAFFMGRSSVVAAGDPGATIANLTASELRFRLGMVAETLIVGIEILVSALLYGLLRTVNQPLALASTLARFAQAVLQAVCLLTAVPALLVLEKAGYMGAIGSESSQALVLLFMDMNAFGIFLWGLIFGFHLLLLGYLVYRSGFWPKMLGILLSVGAVRYLLQSYGHILAPRFDGILETVVIVLSIPGELAFTVWLLWKGVNTKRWEEGSHRVAP